MPVKVPQALRYTLTVWVTLPLDDDNEPAATQREAEKIVIRSLSKTDLCECDAEVIDTEYLDDDGEVIPEDCRYGR